MTAVDDYHFLLEGSVEINAAVVGIGKSRWVHLREDEASPERALRLMKAGRFDVIPIHRSDGLVREYYRAEKWGDLSAAVMSQIGYRDVIPLQTPIREVIRSFARPPDGAPRFFYFLSNEGRIAGLISVANLNSRYVQIYLFSLLCELETRLGKFVRGMNVTEDEIKRGLRGEQRRRFMSDRQGGLEEDAVQYMYLLDLLRFVRKRRLFGTLGYAEEGDFKRLEVINELRNYVAHPLKSLVTRAHTVERLWERIELIEDALFRLRNIDTA